MPKCRWATGSVEQERAAASLRCGPALQASSVMQNNTRATLQRAAVPVQALLLFMAGDALWVLHNAPLPLLVFAGIPIMLAVAVAAASITFAPVHMRRPTSSLGPSEHTSDPCRNGRATIPGLTNPTSGSAEVATCPVAARPLAMTQHSAWGHPLRS